MLDQELKENIKNCPKGTIIVNLDGNAIYTAVSLKEFTLALRHGERWIVTPLTTAIDNWHCCQGYRLIVQSEGKERCINEMLLGNIGEDEKVLRVSHNTEKLILGGVYDIETEWKEL